MAGMATGRSQRRWARSCHGRCRTFRCRRSRIPGSQVSVAQRHRARGAQQPPMSTPTWEYSRIVCIVGADGRQSFGVNGNPISAPSTVALLNAAGAEGWEVIGSQTWTDPETVVSEYLLKRTLTGERPLAWRPIHVNEPNGGTTAAEGRAAALSALERRAGAPVMPQCPACGTRNDWRAPVCAGCGLTLDDNPEGSPSSARSEREGGSSSGQPHRRPRRASRRA